MTELHDGGRLACHHGASLNQTIKTVLVRAFEVYRLLVARFRLTLSRGRPSHAVTGGRRSGDSVDFDLQCVSSDCEQISRHMKERRRLPSNWG